jgi:hypothetical protein
MEASMKMTVFWASAMCSSQKLTLMIALLMEAVNASETSVSFYGLHSAISQTTVIFYIFLNFMVN